MSEARRYLFIAVVMFGRLKVSGASARADSAGDYDDDDYEPVTQGRAWGISAPSGPGARQDGAIADDVSEESYSYDDEDYDEAPSRLTLLRAHASGPAAREDGPLRGGSSGAAAIGSDMENLTIVPGSGLHQDLLFAAYGEDIADSIQYGDGDPVRAPEPAAAETVIRASEVVAAAAIIPQAVAAAVLDASTTQQEYAPTTARYSDAVLARASAIARGVTAQIEKECAADKSDGDDDDDDGGERGYSSESDVLPDLLDLLENDFIDDEALVEDEKKTARPARATLSPVQHSVEFASRAVEAAPVSRSPAPAHTTDAGAHGRIHGLSILRDYDSSDEDEPVVYNAPRAQPQAVARADTSVRPTAREEETQEEKSNGAARAYLLGTGN